jgi:hypothetical protein
MKIIEIMRILLMHCKVVKSLTEQRTIIEKTREMYLENSVNYEYCFIANCCLFM